MAPANRSVLYWQKLSLIIGGLYPLDLSPHLPGWARSLSSALDNSFVVLNLLNQIHITMMILMALMFSENVSLEVRIIQFQEFFTNITVLFYLTVFLLKRKSIMRVIATVENGLPHRSLPGITFIDMNRCVAQSKWFTIVWVVMCVVGTLFHGIQPLFRGYAFESFPFQTQYPFKSALTSPWYETIFFLQMIGQLQLGMIFAGFLALFVSVAKLMTVQYEMLLCSVKNIANSACMHRGDTQSNAVLRKSLANWRLKTRIGKEYFEGDEMVEEEYQSNREDYCEESVSSNDLFACGEYDTEVLVAVIECSRRHALILRICRSVEDIVNLNMLNTVGNVTFFICVMIFALYSIGKVNNATIDFANYLFLGYVELLFLCYYPHLMTYQVGGGDGDLCECDEI